MRKIILSNAFIVGTHFLAGFILQVVAYGMIIRLIRRMRKSIRGKLFEKQLKQHGYPACVLIGGTVYVRRFKVGTYLSFSQGKTPPKLLAMAPLRPSWSWLSFRQRGGCCTF